MNPFLKAVTSSVGKKYIMAITGLMLVGFVVTHLLGNLTLFAPNGTPLNEYAQKLADLGILLEIAEVGLVLIFIVHVWAAVSLSLEAKRARPVGYVMHESKGGNTKSTFSSRHMAILGVLLLAFLIFHVLQFKLGLGLQEGYVDTTDPNRPIRDLYRLVYETFHNPTYVLIYSGAMVVLGLHLRHGIWSAFQSLGVTHPGLSSLIYKLSFLAGLFLALGFFLIPSFIYFGGPEWVAGVLSTGSGGMK